MQKINVVKVSSLNNLRLEQLSNGANSLFITATRSLSYQSNKNKKLNVIDYTQLHSSIKNVVKQKDYMSESEMRYLLYKTIMDLKDSSIKLAYKNSITLLYELFDNLLVSNITADNINLKQIKKSHLISNADVFELYIKYLQTLSKQSKKPYQVGVRDCLREYFAQFSDVCFVGFTFFNDIQNTMFDILVEQGKLACMVANDDFIINEFIVPLLNNRVDYQITTIDNKEVLKFDEIRENLFTSNKINPEISKDVVMYKPFFTREMEFQFIISNIVAALKKCTTKEEIQLECDKIAVVITNNFAKQTQIFNDLLKRQGVFIAPNNKIFFSQDEFLKSSYEKKLSKEQRLQLFNSFSRLEMYEPPKTLFNSVLGRFVCELYKISGNGLKLANFNTLLNINWLFKETEIDDIISEFNVVKDFFEQLQDVVEWKNKINELINLKQRYTFDKELSNHPLKAIRLQSLEFIKKYILFLEHVTNKLQNVNGSVKKHIKALIEAIKSETDDKFIESQLLAEFEEILSLKDDSVSIDYDYFAKNFQTLVSEYLSSKKEKTNNIRLNAINLESSNCYDTVYLPMFENNKYPMSFRYDFPYTKEMVAILQNNSMIKGYKLPLNKTLDYNIKLSKYVFENLFRIAKERIVFTRIDNENGSPLDISMFGYDVMSKFDNYKEKSVADKGIEEKIGLANELIFKDTKLNDMYLNQMLGYFACPKMFYYMRFEDKNCYTDKFLLNFYCKSLIINRTLSTLANGSIYNENSLNKALNSTIKNVAREVFNLLPLFDENNKNDIFLTANKQLFNFVNETMFKDRYKPKNDFTLTMSDEEVISYKGVSVKTYSHLVVTDLARKVSNKFDISKSLDCLITTSGGTQINKEHFWEVVEALISNKSVDRADGLNYLAFKLNTQLNSPKFNQDGIDRVKDVIKYVNDKSCSNLNEYKSSFCSYCKYKNICMGVHND